MIHQLADCMNKNVPESTKIWQFCVVFPNSIIGENCNICSHCLIENDVELLFEEDVKFAIDYCKSKFNNKRGKEWYKQFLTKNCKNSGSN